MQRMTTVAGEDDDVVARIEGLNEVMRANITRLRLHQELTITELARRATIHRVTLSNIESGRRLLSVNDLVPIAHALGASLRDLMEGPADRPVDGGTLVWARQVLIPDRPPEPIEVALRRLIREELGR